MAKIVMDLGDKKKTKNLKLLGKSISTELE
jgi:hypothetical protein